MSSTYLVFSIVKDSSCAVPVLDFLRVYGSPSDAEQFMEELILKEASPLWSKWNDIGETIHISTPVIATTVLSRTENSIRGLVMVQTVRHEIKGPLETHVSGAILSYLICYLRYINDVLNLEIAGLWDEKVASQAMLNSILNTYSFHQEVDEAYAVINICRTELTLVSTKPNGDIVTLSPVWAINPEPANFFKVKACSLIQKAASELCYRPGGVGAKNAEKDFYENLGVMHQRRLARSQKILN